MSYQKHLNDKFKKLNWKHQNQTCFLFPTKSRYNCRGKDVFSKLVELLLLLSYTSMYATGIKVMIWASFAQIETLLILFLCFYFHVKQETLTQIFAYELCKDFRASIFSEHFRRRLLLICHIYLILILSWR